MATGGSYGVEGLKELNAKLKELDNTLAGKALYSALMTAALPMWREVKANAPVASARYKRYFGGGGNFLWDQGGTLQDSVKRKRLTKGDKKRGTGATVGIVLSGKGGPLDDPYYYYWIEYGKTGYPATPFIRPAFDKHHREATERFRKTLGKRIDKLAQG